MTERKFVYPKQVVFSLKQDCSPYLFGLSPKYADHFTTLMEKVGVRKSFESVDIIDALLEIKNKYDGKQLPPDTVGLVSRLTTLFENCDSIPVDNLHLPDTNGYLCHVNDLCINDFDWIATTESMKILNKTISLKVAEMARIKSKRDQSILNDSEEFGHEFGQHEELTNRINRILDGYPEACILKELLQNADDVGATELHFIKDIRCHGTDHILSDAWKKLQGPALCVYNDSVFTEEDLCGIQNLGIGNKRDDLTCTGQYGVGFNVVYSITDVPSFITRDMENNFDNLCVLDPQRKYIPTSPLQRPGRRFQNASKLLAEKYTDMIPCYLEETGIWKSSRGTLFRFPLRCNNDSLLSQRTVNIDELTDLLNKLKCEIAECLVFLHNVRHVSISTVKEDGLLEREFIVTAEISNKVSKENLHTLSRKVQKEMKTDSLYVCRVDRKEFTYELNVNINGQFIQKWLVVNGFGFMDKNVIPIKVQTAYEEKRLALLPISGVAFSIVNKRLTQTSDELTFVDEKLKNSRVYCFLPLPLQTGLPVLINGHFALDNETRRNIWWDNDENQDLKTCWNKCLIENVILPTYISVFHYLKATLFTRGISKTLWSQLNQFHQVFPCMKNSEGNIWQHLTKTLYTRIAETNCCVFPIVKKMCKDKEISFEKQQENDTETQNYDFRRKKAPTLVTKGDNMEIIWVSLQFGAFPAYFNTISYRYRDDSENCFNKNMKPKNSKILSSILKDLGMKIIESPLWIFKSMKDAKVNVQTVSPKAVLEFLKSFRSNLNDKCRIEQVNINVSKTRFRNINWIKQILNYCLKDSNLTALDFQNVPLLVSESLKIHEFVETNQMFLTKKVDLLPFSADKFVHLEQFYMLQSKVFENFVTILGIEDFSNLIVDNIPEEFRQGRIKIWDKEGPCLPNKKWIDSFWDFLSTCIVHIKKEFELKKLRTANTDNEQDDFEHLVAQFCSTLVMYMGNCSFLHVKYADKTYKLYPLNKGKYVLKILPKLNCPEQSALKQLNVPIFDDDDLIYHGRKVSYPENILEISIELLATVDNVQDILDCLYFNRLNLNLEKNACMKMLLFFVRHYEILKETTDCRKKLRCLPFYCGLVDMFMTLSEEDIDVIVVPKKMPLDGLVEFGQNISLVFIKHNDIPLSFFEYIGCIAQNPTDMYINHVLPKFNHMPSKAILQHLKFIKDIILPQLKYNSSRENCRKLSSLEDLLQNIAFIPVRRGGLAKASDFFNPRKEIFKIENQLCCLNELPPTPFDEEDWEEFLVHCGMKSEMTPDIFVNFVKRLERLSNAKDFSDIVRKNSKQMVRILFDNLELHENYSFLQHIANAKFLTPHEIQQDYLTLALKSNLRFERKSRLLCFRGSTLPEYEDLVWTKLEIISKDVTDNMRTADINVAVDRFGFLSIPPLSCVLDHTKNVCNALEDKIKDICTEKSSIEITVTKMMSKIYTFLQEHACFDSVYILKSIPFIFIKERKMLVKPENVVLDIREHEEIPPYLYKASTCFENFFPVFEGHGAAKSLTCNHLAHILSKIWKKSKHEILHQNDRSCIEKAIKILFAKLKSEKADDFNVPVLYLLSKTKSLVKSNELVFTDDRLIEDRIGNDMPDIEFFIECDVLGMKIYDPLSIINKLPENHRPRLLSKVVLEQLDSECKTAIISSDYAKKLQTFLRSPSFFFGVCRLIRDELYQNGNSFSEERAIEIQKRLQSVEVKCVEKLKTIMTFEGKVLPNTIKRKTVFSTTESDHIELTKLIIYFDANGTVNNSTWLKSLNVFLGKPLKDNHIHLLDILRYIKNPNGMERELDSLDICSSRDNRLTLLLFMPELGNVVPTDLHYLLDYSCTYIASEEYVAYELFDHVIDEEYDFDTESEYILAKVIEINGRKDEYPIEDFWTISYLIDIGSGQRIPVEASKLYKFIKNKIVTGNKEVVNNAVVLNWNFDEIKNYITNVLRSAFERGNREFKRILKRLLLQYHPDKHLENKENLQELTLFIEFVNRELENRQSFDNEAMCMFDPNEVFPKSQFTTNVYQLGEIHGVNRINCVSMEEQSGSNFNDFFGPLKLKGSQPEQAKIWFRQAEYDFQASTSDKSQQGAYNWACYKCHQVRCKLLCIFNIYFFMLFL